MWCRCDVRCDVQRGRLNVNLTDCVSGQTDLWNFRETDFTKKGPAPPIISWGFSLLKNQNKNPPKKSSSQILLSTTYIKNHSYLPPHEMLSKILPFCQKKTKNLPNFMIISFKKELCMTIVWMILKKKNEILV